VADARDALSPAWGWLRGNVVREPIVTCRVCATPVDGFDRCWRCLRRKGIRSSADVVAPLIYAIDGFPSAVLLRDYKNDPVRKVRERHTLVINWLVFLAIYAARAMIRVAAGAPVSLRMVKPTASHLYRRPACKGRGASLTSKSRIDLAASVGWPLHRFSAFSVESIGVSSCFSKS